jgi:hypothetical protein
MEDREGTRARQLSEILLRAEPALAHQTITEMLRLAHSPVCNVPHHVGDCDAAQ